jgi:hypothetical protein
MGDAKVNVLYLAGTDEPHFSESFKSNNRDKKSRSGLRNGHLTNLLAARLLFLSCIGFNSSVNFNSCINS